MYSETMRLGSIDFGGKRVKLVSDKAQAQGLMRGKEVVVLPGSQMSKHAAPSLEDAAVINRKLAIANGWVVNDDSNHYRVVFPLHFSSPSAAAKAITGTPASGPKYWIGGDA